MENIRFDRENKEKLELEIFKKLHIFTKYFTFHILVYLGYIASSRPVSLGYIHQPLGLGLYL